METRELFEQTIGALANAVDARDRYTRGHSNRVSHIAEAMCRVMKLSETEIEKIKWAGLLHDVGKIGIRDDILLKEGPLDKRERTLMNRHPVIGQDIVLQASQLKGEAPLIRAHHEWFNGSGYPDGIEALDIPLGARILTIADAYEAMTSSRPYRKIPLTHEQAVEQALRHTPLAPPREVLTVGRHDAVHGRIERVRHGVQRGVLVGSGEEREAPRGDARGARGGCHLLDGCGVDLGHGTRVCRRPRLPVPRPTSEPAG